MKKEFQYYIDIERLKVGEPLDYVIGFTEFLGCKIDLSKKPLIPRPETEFWVEKAIKDIKKYSGSLRVLDIFSGSGCIGIAVLKHVKKVRVDFVDKDRKCLQQIKTNLKMNKPRQRFIVRQSDVFSNIRGKYDFILANPPYVAIKKIAEVGESVLQYEPKQALFAGQDGLLYIRKFLKQAKDHLNPGGKIFMEFSPEQKKEIENILEKNKYINWDFNKDQYGKWRWVVIG